MKGLLGSTALHPAHIWTRSGLLVWQTRANPLNVCWKGLVQSANVAVQRHFCWGAGLGSCFLHLRFVAFPWLNQRMSHTFCDSISQFSIPQGLMPTELCRELSRSLGLWPLACLCPSVPPACSSARTGLINPPEIHPMQSIVNQPAPTSHPESTLFPACAKPHPEGSLNSP